MQDGIAPSVTLSPRLQTVADAVPVCDTVADIGSDHGYVPLYLLEKKRARRVIVSDLRQGPLAKARQNFCQTSYGTQADFRLGSGLEILQAGEADGIILAGMGGPLMRELLQARPEVYRKLAFIILQPMTGQAMLRRSLRELGLKIDREWLCEEGKHLYEIIRVVPGTQDLPEELAAVGPYLWESRSPLLARHLQRLIQRAQSHRNGLLHAKERSAARQVELYSLEKHIAQWKEMLQQCESER